MQSISNLVQVTVITAFICLVGLASGMPQSDHTDLHSHWDSTVKAFDDTTRRLKDFGSDVNDETSKFFGNIADTAVSVPQSHWDATVQAFDNTGKKLREFGTDFRDGSTKFFNDLSHGSSNQSGAQSVIFNLYYVLALLLAAYAFN